MTTRITKDIKKAAATLTNNEARYLVDTYYQMQEFRKATNNQCRSITQSDVDEPHETLSFFANQFTDNENDIKKALDEYVKAQPIGRWMTSICGIGPVLSAGLIANIDIKKAPTAGHIWNYAGLNPLQEWKKGEKRPWNARLKTICWLLGECFVKVCNNDKDVYGHIYKERKEYELAKNEAGEYAEEAAKQLDKKKFAKNTDAYKAYIQGKLPLAHIQSRAKRYAVKMFLSHLQQVWWEMETGEKAPKPFAIAILGHAHEIVPPNYPIEG